MAIISLSLRALPAWRHSLLEERVLSRLEDIVKHQRIGAVEYLAAFNVNTRILITALSVTHLELNLVELYPLEPIIPHLIFDNLLADVLSLSSSR